MPQFNQKLSMLCFALAANLGVHASRVTVDEHETEALKTNISSSIGLGSPCSTDIVVSAGRENFRVEPKEYATIWKYILSKSAPDGKVSSYSLGCVNDKVTLRKDKYENGELATREQRFFGGLLHQWRSTSLRKSYNELHFNQELKVSSSFPMVLKGSGTVRFTPAKDSCDVTRHDATQHMNKLAKLTGNVCEGHDSECESVRALDFKYMMSEAGDLSRRLRQLEAMACADGSEDTAHAADVLQTAARQLYYAAYGKSASGTFDIAYAKLDGMGCSHGSCRPTVSQLREVFSLLVHGPSSDAHAAILQVPISNDLFDKAELHEDEEGRYELITSDLAKCIAQKDCSSTEETAKMYAREFTSHPEGSSMSTPRHQTGSKSLLQNSDAVVTHHPITIEELEKDNRQLAEQNRRALNALRERANEPRWVTVARNIAAFIATFLLAITLLALSPIIIVLALLVSLFSAIFKTDA